MPNDNFTTIFPKLYVSLFPSVVWDASGKMADGVGAGATETRGHPDLCEGVRFHFPGTLITHLERHEHQLTLHNLSLAALTPEVLQQRDTMLRGRYCLVSVRWVLGQGSQPTTSLSRRA